MGIGLRQVLVITESKSDSYHIFNAPAAPEPKATAVKENIASIKLTLSGAINKPTAIIAKTIKGKGVPFMENNNDWHHGRLTQKLFDEAVKGL